MNNIKSILKKELNSYLVSPATYIVLVIFLLITGWYFNSTVFVIGQAEMRSLFSTLPILFLFFIPAITMGMIAKEKNTGTIEILTTLPIQDSQIVLGKFLAALILMGVTLLFTVIHLITIVRFGENIDYGSIFWGYIGLLLVSATYCAIGVFGSSLHSNQIVAFIISFVLVFFFFIIEVILVIFPGPLAEFFQYLSFNYHFSNLQRGVVDTRDIIYFGSMIILFLKGATISLESRKWN
ncbi:MAG: ABC transporter permease subunit [Candidatus Cloacimonetes bacterium]|nr:ABC transporter permease subunit [Candidatus Cloacimonadota bacterium]